MTRSRRTKPKLSSGSMLAVLATILIFAVIVLGAVYDRVTVKVTKAQQYEALLNQLGGQNGQNRTLILFTNNAEMRYGGGFIGSVGYIQAQKRRKPTIDPIHSVYYYDHRIDQSDSRLQPASPELAFLTPSIWLRDSGIDLDWPHNAARAAQLFELESGKPVDSVVMITPNVIKELLKLTGPVYLKDYGFSVTSDNFLEKVQLEVEAGDDKQAGKDPKTILGVLGNAMLTKLFESTSITSFGQYRHLVTGMTQQKQLAIYSKNNNTQRAIREVNMDGGLQPADGIYLLVAEANVGANKSSPFIRQDIEQKVTIDQSGRAMVDVVLHRHHTGKYSHQYVDPHDGLTKWLVGNNVSFIKLALPYGSKVTSASFTPSRDVYSESGRSIVTFLSTLEPGAAETYRFSYELPFRYVMGDKVVVPSYFEKPIGSQGQTVSQAIVLPSGYKRLSGSSPDKTNLDSDIDTVTVYKRS